VREDIIAMAKKESRKFHVIKKFNEGYLKRIEASEILSLSTRQVSRLSRRVIEEGELGIVHKSRGKPSNRRISDETKKRVVKLYRKTYKGFGPTLASEKLLELDNIDLSKETLRNWLIESGDWEKIRKGRKHRQWRVREKNVGQMVQLDGSEHDWFEGRGLKSVFMGYIDDATNNVFGRFYNYEGTIPAFDSFKGYAKKNGIPLSVYLDMHTTYRSPAKPTIEDE